MQLVFVSLIGGFLTMTNNELILNVLAGGLLGMIGQGIRMTIGLKKVSDNSFSLLIGSNNSYIGRLFAGIFIAFVIGSIGMIILSSNQDELLDDGEGKLTTQSIVTIVSIAYIGVDIIENLLYRKH